MVFPYIGQRVRRRSPRRRPTRPSRFVVLDAAVMLEAGWDGACDRLVYVDAPRERAAGPAGRPQRVDGRPRSPPGRPAQLAAGRRRGTGPTPCSINDGTPERAAGTGRSVAWRESGICCRVAGSEDRCRGFLMADIKSESKPTRTRGGRPAPATPIAPPDRPAARRGGHAFGAGIIDEPASSPSRRPRPPPADDAPQPKPDGPPPSRAAAGSTPTSTGSTPRRTPGTRRSSAAARTSPSSSR